MGRRGFLLVLFVGLASAGALGVVGVGSGLDGASAGWAVAALGALVAVATVLTLLNHRRPREGSLPAAEVDGAGVRLPLRPGFAARQAVVAACLGACALPGAFLVGSGVAWAVAVLLAAAGLAAGGWLAGPGARASSVRLDPEGITVPRGLGSTRRLTWSEVHRVEIADSWQPHLLLVTADGAWTAVRLLPQAWPPATLEAAVRTCSRSSALRRQLTRPEALERFRSQGTSTSDR